MIKNINFKVIYALFKRDLRLYFTNPTGYVFITLFIFLSAAAAFWQDRFFLNNLANLDLLNNVFPYLLLFFIPALTMGIWADERKQGTDELLLTIPGTDLEIVLGKYLAALGVYTASLILSLSHVIVLFWLGSPDLGLMFGNYIGLWLIGAAFISVGMLASQLVPNATIAFILGAIFCSTFIFISKIFLVFGESFLNFMSSMSVFEPFNDFSRGVISFSGFLYFISLTAMMLYINIILLSKRHWLIEADGYKMWMHQLVRTVAIIVMVISLNAILGRVGFRLDVTAERLHSLLEETRRLLYEIPDDRPVLIQAFISKEVPQHFVQQRENLLGFLREIDALTGDKVQVLIHDTEPFTDEARDAREKFSILPMNVSELGSARAQVSQVFMGVAFTSGAEEEVIPFFDRGLPVEYELIRSIRVAARTQRRKIGVLNTKVRLSGGLDFQTFQSTPPWQVVDELKKQYDVVEINATEPIFEELDGLLVVLPSSLTQEEMYNLMYYIEEGNPTLMLIDPLPYFNIGLSPSEEAGADRNPFMSQDAPPEPKGDIYDLLNVAGVSWNTAQIVWDTYNPHPDLANLPPEFVFLGASNEDAESFNQEHNTTAELQELVLLFPGSIGSSMNPEYKFTPLLKSGTVSGALFYQQMVQRSFFGTQMVPSQYLPHYPGGAAFTLAAHIKGEIAPFDSAAAPINTNVIVIADIDFISDQFFMIRQQAPENLNFDNVTFFLNCMDVLVGDESFIDLRNRRVKHRTLEAVEAQVRKFDEKRRIDQQEAETEAQILLQEAQRSLNERVAEVQQRADLDEQTKQIMANNLQEVENRRFNAQQANIQAEKEMKVQRSKEEMEANIRSIQSGIKMLAALLPPVPVLFMGVMIFVRRRRREREGEAAARRLRS